MSRGLPPLPAEPYGGEAPRSHTGSAPASQHDKIITIILATVFTAMQEFEYLQIIFTIADSVICFNFIFKQEFKVFMGKSNIIN